MKKKTRLIVLFTCVALFLLITPYIVLYSLGYRVDFDNLTLVATGGIYVKTSPDPDTLTINAKPISKTGIFSISYFAQNLLPKNHLVVITKEGYSDYQKTLPVKENQVTKLEHVILFKKNILLTELTELPKTMGSITALQWGENTNTLQFVTKTNLYQLNLSDLATKPTLAPTLVKPPVTPPTKSTETKKEPFSLESNTLYKNIIIDPTTTPATINQTTIATNVTAFLLSQDQQKLIYWNNSDVFVYTIKTQEKALLGNYNKKITNVIWLENDYIIIALQDNILISEIDYRGNVNTITLPIDTMALQNPNILFNNQDKKIYLLNQNILYSTDRLLPQ